MKAYLACVTALILVLRTHAANPGDTDLSFDTGSGANVNLYAVAIQPDGKVIIGGTFTSVQGVECGHIARLNADGSVDTSFNQGTGADNYVTALALQPDGKITLGGWFSEVNGITSRGIARLNSDGSVDASFTSYLAFFPRVSTLALQSDGKVLFGARYIENGQTRAIGRVNTDGTEDTSFTPPTLYADFAGGDFYATVSSIAIQPNGKILVLGDFGAPGWSSYGIVRLNTNGSLDRTFVVTNSSVNCVAPQPDGKVLLGGSFQIGGVSYSHIVARVDSNGIPDSTFNLGTGTTPPRGSINSIMLQPDGKILVVGVFGTYNGVGCSNIVRLNVDGTLDTNFLCTFTPGLFSTHRPFPPGAPAIAIQSDAKVIIGGWFAGVNGVRHSGIVRLIGGDFPVITLQPQSQFVTAGDEVTLTVAAGGNPLPEFQWLKDGASIADATNSFLTLTDMQKGDEGLYSVIVSNRLGAVTSDGAALHVNRPPVADASATDPVVISPNGVNAEVVLDSSDSFDPDGDPLQFAWYETGNLLTTNEVTTVILHVGTHPLRLVVSDGMASQTNAINIEVLTTAEGVQRLIGLVNAHAARPQPLRATLSAALASINRGNAKSASKQLSAFENQVRAQVAPNDPVLARTLIQVAQDVINAL